MGTRSAREQFTRHLAYASGYQECQTQTLNARPVYWYGRLLITPSVGLLA
ncbi:hypothetical protein EC9_24160 [Rosistilla ulvae]|uniref:Uncharacterized protein n=1 Tax=Rosistilla ulvae TaxID=1930277 RepID=A0A517M024_9BACT|nr:hypothetical protein EC9_24160 [Rosistilla ulvae]